MGLTRGADLRGAGCARLGSCLLGSVSRGRGGAVSAGRGAPVPDFSKSESGAGGPGPGPFPGSQTHRGRGPGCPRLPRHSAISYQGRPCQCWSIGI
jgi:hypothetical protein